MTTLLRLIVVVPLAYVAAVIGGGLTVAVGFAGVELGGEPPEWVVVAAALSTMNAGFLSFFPALGAIALAEIFRFRSAFYYLTVGGVIGLAVDRLAEITGNLQFAERRFVIYLAAGFVGGFIYWLIAGRHAGVRAVGEPAPDASR